MLNFDGAFGSGHIGLDIAIYIDWIESRSKAVSEVRLGASGFSLFRAENWFVFLNINLNDFVKFIIQLIP